MQQAVEVGKIVEGKVTGITKFGAFVELDGGTVGMVHISEISSTYVNDISEHLKEQQKVNVKVLSVSDDGKVSLSIKKAMPDQQLPRRESRPSNNDRGTPQRFNNGNNNRNSSGNGNNSSSNSRSGGYHQKSYNNSSDAPRSSSGGFNRNKGFNGGNNNGLMSQNGKPANFEDMLSKFMTSSDEKICDLKREKSSRRGGHQKRSRDYDS